MDRFPPFYRDRYFLLAIFGGIAFWLAFGMFFSVSFDGIGQIASWGFFSLVIWQPALEELLFRGVLQGELYQRVWGKNEWAGFSGANWITSLLFMAGHVWFQSNFWAFAVIIPSLIFGFFRDRFRSVYPAILLHAFYNGGFFLLVGAQG